MPRTVRLRKGHTIDPLEPKTAHEGISLASPSVARSNKKSIKRKRTKNGRLTKQSEPASQEEV